ATADGLCACIPYQSRWLLCFVHHIVACIDTCCTLHTFQLYTVANVDTGRTYGNTLITINACSAAFAVPAFCPWLSAHMIIGYRQRPVVHQRRHITPIRAYNHTCLFPETGEDCIEHPCKQQKRNDDVQMCSRAICN